MDVPMDHPPFLSRRMPVRLGNLGLIPAHSLRQSSVGLKRRSMYIQESAEAPGLVQMKTINLNQNFNPEPFKYSKPLTTKVEPKIPVKRPLQALQKSQDKSDMNQTVGGFDTPLSSAKPPEQRAEPREKKPRRWKTSNDTRGYSLQKLAIHQCMLNKQAAKDASSSSPSSECVTIPDTPTIVIRPLNPLNPMTKQPATTSQLMIPNEPGVVSNAAELKQSHSSLETSANSGEDIANVVGNHAGNLEPVTTSISCQPPVSIAPAKKPECVNNPTSNVVGNTSLLKEMTATDRGNIASNVDQLRVLEKGIAENIGFQKRCLDELNIVRVKQLELEAEMQKLSSGHQQLQNEFMAACRNIAKLRCTQLKHGQVLSTIKPQIPASANEVSQIAVLENLDESTENNAPPNTETKESEENFELLLSTTLIARDDCSYRN